MPPMESTMPPMESTMPGNSMADDGPRLLPQTVDLTSSSLEIVIPTQSVVRGPWSRVNPTQSVVDLTLEDAPGAVCEPIEPKGHVSPPPSKRMKAAVPGALGQRAAGVAGAAASGRRAAPVQQGPGSTVQGPGSTVQQSLQYAWGLAATSSVTATGAAGSRVQAATSSATATTTTASTATASTTTAFNATAANPAPSVAAKAARTAKQVPDGELEVLAVRFTANGGSRSERCSAAEGDSP